MTDTCVDGAIATDYSAMPAAPADNLVVCPDCGKVGKVKRVKRQGKIVVHAQKYRLEQLSATDFIMCVADTNICWLGENKALIVHPNK